jgi:hypothetical protein
MDHSVVVIQCQGKTKVFRYFDQQHIKSCLHSRFFNVEKARFKGPFDEIL